MRGSTSQQVPMLSILTPEQLVPEDHPLRRIKMIVDRALAEESPAFDATSFTKNRDRLLSHEVAPRFFQAVLAQARAARLISAEHFSVDGTLLEAWASLKSFQPRDAADHRPRGGRGGTRNP